MASLCEDAFENDGGSARTSRATPPYPPSETEQDDLDWCVDLNPALSAMTTTELWSAIAEGKVSRDTRAWRPGLEAWATLSEIHEFARAFNPPDAEPMSETGVTPPAIEIMSLTPPATDVGRAHPPVWGGDPRTKGDGALWAESTGGRLRGALIDLRWAVAGAAIAATFIGLSLAVTSPPEPRSTALASGGSSEVRAAVATAAAALEAKPARRSSIERVASPRSELGQRRLRGGSGHGRGR